MGKPLGKSLYMHLRRVLQKRIGPFKIESLACCIHFVSTFTFAAVKIFKEKIRVEFTLNRKIRSKRFDRFLQLSTHRYLYLIDINTADAIDRELIEWMDEAHVKRRTLENAV